MMLIMMGAVDSGEEHDGENKKKKWTYTTMARREIVIAVTANY